MEITPEIKAKVFAQYFGQYVQCDSEYHGKKELNERTLFGLPPCKLILKPLSAITDEDAIEVAKLNGLKGNIIREDDDNLVFIEKEGVVSKYYMDCRQNNVSFYNNMSAEHYETSASLQSFQYLQSKGYDLPNYLLGGKTLQEAGLAIYENK